MSNYTCPNCGETNHLKAVVRVYFERVPLSDDGFFNAFDGDFCDTEVVSIYCENCGKWSEDCENRKEGE